MKLSLDWINDYVDISDIDPMELAEKLTMMTAEVEEVVHLKRLLHNVVVAEVVRVNTISIDSGFSEIIVNCGDREVRTITTTKTLTPGVKTAFARLGTVLNGKRYVQLKEIAGAESKGKVCSPRDLCLGEVDDDIFHIPAQIPNGIPLIELIPERDSLLIVDNHSITHRPDLWGHYGFAREISAILNRPLKPLKLWEEVGDKDLQMIPLEIRDKNRCQIYNCVRLDNLVSSPSSPQIQARLNALDQRAVNLLVDLTNYVMFETGQALHAYDGDRISGIIVNSLKKKTELKTLDGNVRKLEKGDLAILDEKEKPIGIAGVMGGFSTQVTAETKSILLESAGFRGSAIRKTANRLNLVTEASRRFEKQQPAAISLIGLKRMVALIREEQPTLAIGSLLTTVGDTDENARSLQIPLDFFSKRMGIEIGFEEIQKHLQAIGFGVSRKNRKIRVEIPPFRSRSDIAIPEDILEEVARLHGYEKVSPALPSAPMEPASRDSRLSQERAIKRFLSEKCRFREVETYNWLDEDFLPSLEYDSGDCVRLLNPVSPGLVRLRDSLLPNLLQIVQQNRDHHSQNNIYEMGRIFQGDRESRSLLALSYQSTVGLDIENFYRSLKGELEDLLANLQVPTPQFLPIAGVNPAQTWYRQGVRITVEADTLGMLGMVPAGISDSLMKNSCIAWFELDLDRLETLDKQEKRYMEPSRYPGSWFDFSVLFPDDTLFHEIDEKLDKYSCELPFQKTYLYKYKGGEISENMTSYTYRYEVEAIDRTLSGKELDNFHSSLVEFFKREGIQVR